MDVCNSDLMGLYEILGIILLIVKIIIPLIIVVYGTFDFYKAVVSSEEGNLKKNFFRFIKRVIAGIFILFIPSVVLYVFEAFGGKDSSSSCIYDCILSLKCEGTSGDTSHYEDSIVGSCTVENETCIDKSILYGN